MAALNFTVPAAALAALDNYAQDKRFADFHEMTVQWMKTAYRNAKKEQNRLQATDLVQQEPPEPPIT